MATVMSMLLQNRNPMIPAGEFLPRQRAAGSAAGLAARVGIGATLIALVAGAAAAAALLLWLVSILLPVALLAGFVAYTAFRIQFGMSGRPAGFVREI